MRRIMPKNTAAADGKPSVQLIGKPAPHAGNAISWTLAIVIMALGVIATVVYDRPWPLAAAIVVSILELLALQVANAWERAVVLRAGKFQRLAGPGVFWMIPVIDRVAEWVDQRVQTTSF